MDKEQAVKNIRKAINDLFAIRPKLSVPEAKQIMDRLAQEIEIIRANIAWMQENFEEFRDKN
jgi:hypothetical protein